MAFQAISLDTQVFEHHSFNFNSGVLQQLKRLKSEPVEVVLSSVVYQETLKHLSDQIQKAYSSFDKARRDADRLGLGEVSGMDIRETTPPVRAKAILDQYLDEIGATTLPSDDLPVGPILDRYFQSEPPFGKGPKKNEFPDAITLLTLERWATSNKYRVLAVSGDDDWRAFGDKSECLEIIETLEEALDRLQGETDAVREQVIGVVSRATTSDLASPHRSHFFKLLSEELAQRAFDVDTDGTFLADLNQVDVTLRQVNSWADSVEDVRLLGIDAESIVAEVTCSLKVEASADISLYKWDGVDDEFVPMGSSHPALDLEMEVELILHLKNSPEPTDAEITRVEIASAPDSIDFGDVEPDGWYFDED